MLFFDRLQNEKNQLPRYTPYRAVDALFHAADDSTAVDNHYDVVHNEDAVAATQHYKAQLIITETLTYTPAFVHGMTVPKNKLDSGSGHIWVRPAEFRAYELNHSENPNLDCVMIHEITHNGFPGGGEAIAYAMERAPRSRVDSLLDRFTYLHRRA